MKVLNIRENKINDEVADALAQSIPKIQTLGLMECSLTTIGWKSVFSGIAKLDEKVLIVFIGLRSV